MEVWLSRLVLSSSCERSLTSKASSCPVRAVIWDLDGTLANSEAYHWIAWRDVLHGEGVTITYEQFLGCFGQRNDRILGAWMPGASADTVRRVGDAKEAAFRRLAAERGLTPLPGAAEWVRRLGRDGWRQAIASSAPRLNVDAMLHALGLDSLFQVVTSAEDVTRGKPDPQVFLIAASRLDVPAPCSVVVEDAAAGIEAARRAGMRSVGVSRTARLEADVFVESLDALEPDVFDRLVREAQERLRSTS